MNRKAILKFIIATIIFYLVLAFNVFHIGEKLTPEKTGTIKDYLKEDVKIENIDIEEEYFSTITTNDTSWHFVAESSYERLYQNLCNRANICDKIILNGITSTYDKYAYTRATIALIDFVDNNWSTSTTLKNTIKKIDINKTTWTRRWYATRDSIIMNLWSVKTKKEFAELLTHEMGHIIDLGYIQWTSIKKENTFTEFGKSVFAINDPSIGYYKYSRQNEKIRKTDAKKKDFCSGYGMTDPFEDFAECFNLYLNHNIFFREIAKTNSTLTRKYNFIATIVAGKYMASNNEELKIIKNNTTRRPRDTTKLTNN